MLYFHYMNRKHFLSSVLPLGAFLPGFSKGGKLPALQMQTSFVIPPYLQPGDCIGITCPAGFITQQAINPAIEQLQTWGLQVVIGETVGKRNFTYGGTDAERVKDLQQMLDDVSIKAIMCARGGYGSVRIIDKLNFFQFKKHPKWLIGFSDITVLHSHIHQQLQIATIHSKMCNSFPDDWAKAEEEQKATIVSIREALMGNCMQYQVPATTQYNVLGDATGLLVGGNLKTLESLSATNSDIDTAGKILFVEDTGEYLYSIDRMFWNLERSGKLKNLAGLLIGGFKIKEDTEQDFFGSNLYDIVLEKVKKYHYPVCFNFPVGHQRNNYALKCGVLHHLQVSDACCVLQELYT